MAYKKSSKLHGMLQVRHFTDLDAFDLNFYIEDQLT